MQKKVIMVTNYEGENILIGVDSIIRVYKQNNGVTKIESRHAMVTSTYCAQSVEEVYLLIEGQHLDM